MTHLPKIVATSLFCLSAIAGTAGELPDSKQSKLGLYMTAEETAAFLERETDAVMIDVRTPGEIDETGLAAGTDALIPLLLPDTRKGAVFNPDFVQGIAQFATRRGLAADHPIVMICRSGNRSAQAADVLAQMGFTNVFTVTDGYEGDRAATGPSRGERTVNGWKNAGLPWEERAAASCAPAEAGGAC